jgi:hypothetical protein
MKWLLLVTMEMIGEGEKMKQIRFGVFETNSSSTHSLTICTSEEWEQFLDGKLVLDFDELVEPSKAESDRIYDIKKFQERSEILCQKSFKLSDGTEMVATSFEIAD